MSRAYSVLVWLSLAPAFLYAQDAVELATGAKVHGRVISQLGGEITVEVVINGKPFTRKFSKDKVRAVSIGGKVSKFANDQQSPKRSQSEIEKLIDHAGQTLPEWLESTELSIPPTLDLSWPQPPPQPWDNSRNVGQFVWDRINPNPNQWRKGVKLMHHIMDLKKGDSAVVRRAMLALGGMYHNLLADYPRAAYWLRSADVDKDPDSDPHAGLQLANCYFRLGSKPMAIESLKSMRRLPLSAIKLWGDFGEPATALKLAEQFAQNSPAVTCYLYAGDVCRVAGRLEDATLYYRKALAVADKDSRDNDHSTRDRQRAEACLAAIEFYRLDPRELADGTYVANSLGYEDQIEVTVEMRQGRITSVQVTQHREKQFYSSISDTPPRILARQSVNNVDTVTGATITSEAIINATAKALAKGRK